MVNKLLPHSIIQKTVDTGYVRWWVVSSSSAGTCGFQGTRRGTPFAAQTAATNVIRAIVDQGIQRAKVMIKGLGLGRDAALRAIRRSVIMEYLVKISKKARILELKRRHLKIIVLTSNTPYPSRKI
ncbi:ribosomal protein S11 [Tanacetum coccineum]